MKPETNARAIGRKLASVRAWALLLFVALAFAFSACGSSSPSGIAPGSDIDETSPACALDLNEVESLTGKPWQVVRARTNSASDPIAVGMCDYATQDDRARVLQVGMTKNSQRGTSFADSYFMRGTPFAGKSMEIQRVMTASRVGYICKEIFHGRPAVEAVLIGNRYSLTIITPMGIPNAVSRDQIAQVVQALFYRAQLD